MKLKKLTALILIAVLVLSALAGCKKAESNGGDTAYSTLKPETVMLTVNGGDIVWSELFYLLHYIVSDIEQQGESIKDWSEIYADDKTYQDYVLESAVEIILQNSSIEYGAQQLGVTLSEEDKNAVKADWEAQVSAVGSEEALLEELGKQYGSKELFEKYDSIAYLAEACFNEMYGQDGSKLSDQDVADYTAEDGYLMAKHILLMTSNMDDEGNTVPMTEKEKAAVYDKAEEILNALKNYDGDDFDAFFDAQMQEHSQDPGGLVSFPDGYLFQDGDMVKEFEEATKALEIGGLSGIVETSYGYHIVYRLPVDYDATPMAYATYGAYSLRYLTAVDMFKSVVKTWKNSLEVTYSDAYDKLDFNKLFPAKA
jgi:parvulin-like peptidyl-prolyl isomerase